MDKHRQHAELRKRSRELREIIRAMNGARRRLIVKNKAAHSALMQRDKSKEATRIMAQEHAAFLELKATFKKYRVVREKFAQALNAQSKGARR